MCTASHAISMNNIKHVNAMFSDITKNKNKKNSSI